MIESVNVKTGALANPKASETDKLKAVAKQFEAVFMRQMIGSMRQAKLTDDEMGSDATDQFTEMQDSHIADNLAGKGALGIADLLVKQFSARVGTTKSDNSIPPQQPARGAAPDRAYHLAMPVVGKKP
jgi:flagellar protein FlgJ